MAQVLIPAYNCEDHVGRLLERFLIFEKYLYISKDKRNYVDAWNIC